MWWTWTEAERCPPLLLLFDHSQQAGAAWIDRLAKFLHKITVCKHTTHSCVHSCRKNSSCRQVQPTSLPWKIPSLLLGSLIACLHHLVYYCILHVYKGSGDRLHCMGGYEYNSPPAILSIFIPSNPNTPLLLAASSPWPRQPVLVARLALDSRCPLEHLSVRPLPPFLFCP